MILLHQSHSSNQTHINHWITYFTKIILIYQNFYYNNFSNICLYKFHNTNNSNHKLIYLIQQFHPPLIITNHKLNSLPLTTVLTFLTQKKVITTVDIIHYNFVSFGDFLKLYQHLHTKIKPMFYTSTAKQ